MYLHIIIIIFIGLRFWSIFNLIKKKTGNDELRRYINHIICNDITQSITENISQKYQERINNHIDEIYKDAIKYIYSDPYNMNNHFHQYGLNDISAILINKTDEDTNYIEGKFKSKKDRIEKLVEDVKLHVVISRFMK